PRNIPYHAARILLAHVQGNVGLGNDAAKAALCIHHRDAANLVLFHLVAGFLDVRVVAHGDHVPRHHVRHRGTACVHPGGHGAYGDVTVGNHANDPLRICVLDDRNLAAVVFEHHL